MDQSKTSLERHRVADLEADLRRRREAGENVEFQEWTYETPDEIVPAAEARRTFVALRRDFANLVRAAATRLRKDPSVRAEAETRCKAAVASAAAVGASE